MALDKFPLFGDDQPGMLEMGVETDFASPASVFKYTRTLGNPGGLESLHRYMQEDMSIRQTLNKRPMLPGYVSAGGFAALAPGATVTTRHYLAGFQNTLPVAADYTAAAHATTGYPLVWVLDAVLGGKSVNALLTAIDGAGSTTTKFDCTNGSLSGKLNVGGAVTVDTSAGATPRYESGYAETVTPGAMVDEIDLRAPVTAAPGDTKAVYGSVTCYDRSYLTDSYSLRWTGHAVGATTPLRVTLVGCVPSAATINLAAFEFPTIEVTWMVAAAFWDDTSAVFATPQTWAYPAPEQVVGGRAFFHSGGAITASTSTPNVSISIDNGLVQLQANSAEFGVYTCIKTGQSITISLDAPYTADSRIAYAAQTEGGLHMEWGTQPGKRFVLNIPMFAIESFSGPTSEGGVAFCSIMGRATTYTGDTGAALETEPGDKACSISIS